MTASHIIYTRFLGSISKDVKVVRNDKIDIAGIASLSPSHIVLSPGPGYPDSAGICMECVRKFAGRTPVLGVCLGHQSIAQAFGGTIVHAPVLMHGKVSVVSLDTGDPLFQGLPDKITAMRYHSLVADEKTLPGCFKVTARDEQGDIMGISIPGKQVFGIQFHPESFKTEHGADIIRNFCMTGCHSDDLH